MGGNPEKGHNRLLSPDKCERLVDVVSEIQRSKLPKFLPLYGDGNAGEKFANTFRIFSVSKILYVCRLLTV